MSTTNTVTGNDIRALLKTFSTKHYSPLDTNSTTEAIENKCLHLISKDYPNLFVLANENGELSDSYPAKIIIPHLEEEEVDEPSQQQINLNGEKAKETTNNNNKNNENSTSNGTSSTTSSNNHNRLNVGELKQLMSKARIARCRARFPIPVILYKNKYICRSATLSGGAEIYGRSVFDTLNYSSKSNNTSTNNITNKSNVSKLYDSSYNEEEEVVDCALPVANNTKSYSIGDTSQIFSKVRSQDIKLLKQLNIRHICDLMLENKKVKFFMNVTSSEKIDKENRYSDFDIISLPYPGCEFFREYRDNAYSGEGLVYNWNQNFVDAKLDIPEMEILEEKLHLTLADYRQWDIIKLTLAYIRLLLYYIREYDSSLLIHCISGWDRTPLFISLLRLTLWADGEIHNSLSAVEITYLTVAYDWFLFGHNLNDRLVKGEEIMFFCFQFLKFITETDFEVDYKPANNSNTAKSKSIFINNNTTTKEAMAKHRKISLDLYTNNGSGDDSFTGIDNLSGSLCSLTSNSSSLISGERLTPATSVSSCTNGYCHYSPKQHHRKSISSNPNHREAAYVLASSPPVMLQMGSSNGSAEHIPMERLSLYEGDVVGNVGCEEDDMESTLTSSKVFENSNGQRCSSPAPLTLNANGHQQSVISEPMAIPNAGKKFCTTTAPNGNNNSGHTNKSLSRSDSWQLVTDAGSIRDKYFYQNSLVNHYSSPDSLGSLNRTTGSAGGGTTSSSSGPSGSTPAKKTASDRLHKANRRKERLNEVRSIFNSAYTSLSIEFNNSAGRWIFSKQKMKTTNF